MVTKLLTVCGATLAPTSATTKSPRDVCTVALYFLAASTVIGGGVVRSAIGSRLHSGRLPGSDGGEGRQADREGCDHAECGADAGGGGDPARDKRSDEESERHRAGVDAEDRALRFGR